MTSGERDDLVETMLKGGALREAGDAAGDACLDAESAAAWLDGGLTGAALVTAQAHVAGCGRCQDLLRALMDSEGSNAPAAAPAVVARPDFGRRDATPAAARRTWLTWGTPISAAIAATLALAVWLRVPSPDSAPQSAPAQSQVTAESARTNEQPTSAPAPDALRNEARPQAAAAATPAAAAAAKSVAPATSPVAPPMQPPGENRLVGGVSGGVVGGIASISETAAAPPPPPPPPPSPAPATTGAAAEPPASAAPAAALRERSALAADAVARVAIDVRAQTGIDRWRVSGTRIERSRNDGQTWSVIGAADGPALTAASAPAVGICWFVGRSGTVLVFDDAAGVQRVSVPDGADLVGVAARSAREAVVVTADGRRLRTVDAGRTWTTER